MSQTTTPQAARPAQRMLNQARWETLAMIKNGEQLVLILFMPLIALVALAHTSVLDRLGLPRIDAATPGVLALAVLSTAFTGQAIATGFDRRYGVLTHAATTPLGRSGLLAGKCGAVLVVVTGQLVLMGGVAEAMGLRMNWGGVVPLIVSMLLGIGALTSVGLFIAGLVRPEATLAVTNLLWIVFAGAGGVLFPAHFMPAPLSHLIPLLPTSALADAFRSAINDGAWAPLPMLVLLVWTLVCSAGVLRTFKWTS
jgi:ABC-2 type transport system permease protein